MLVVEPPSVQIAFGWLSVQVLPDTRNVLHWFAIAPPPEWARAIFPMNSQPLMLMFWHTHGTPGTHGAPLLRVETLDPVCGCRDESRWVRMAGAAVRFLQEPCALQAKMAPPDAFAILPWKTLSRITAEPRSENIAPPVLCVAPIAVLLMKWQPCTSINPHIHVYSAPPW